MQFPKKEHYTVDELYKMANEMRTDLIKMLTKAGSGHSASPLGTMEIWTAFYFHILNHNPKKPDWEERDRLILSCGHYCPARYTVMAHAGYFPHEELWTLRKWGTRLQGHPERERLPGVETTSGPLGSGLSQAAGMAKAAQMAGKKWWTYVLMSDGEQQAGQTWEAAMFASHNHLGNLIGIVDRNNIQINGFTENVMPLEPLMQKYEAFGWHVQDIDGHNIEELIDAVNHAKAVFNKPSVIIAHTIPGRGVEFMERKFEWHGKPPKPEEAIEAIKEIRTLGGKIRSEHE
uniref:Transketolase n=1 Tax=candidate division WWE3 bacterium TaxID=2053526 RepID=A0A832DS32_UNCKA